MGKSIILFITLLTSLPFLGLSQANGSKVIAEAAATWTAEEKDWFKSTFIIKRGCFRIPDKPIQYPFFEK